MEKTLISKPFPKMVQEFAKENFNLKMLCFILLGTTFLSLLLVLVLVERGPTVVALNSTGEISQIDTKVTDLQIEAAAKAFLHYRYSWNPSTISSQIEKARFFVAPSLMSDFDKSMIPVKQYVAQKEVTDRVYPRSMAIDFKNKSIKIVADRITAFGELKAATVLNVTLNFEIADRTVTNPWGVYITQETESEGAQ